MGHVRYSTHGDNHLKNIQPFLFNYRKGWLAVAHNGNLTNAVRVRRELERHGSIFQTTSDTEIINHLIARSQKNGLVNRITEALLQVKGAYSLLFMTEDRLIAVRDSYGFRPLLLGDLDGSPVIASESTAFDLIGAKMVREIEPGEILVIRKDGPASAVMESFFPFPKTEIKQCIFEHIYFARPDSYIFGRNVYQMRTALVLQLAKEQPAKAEVVIPVPDS